MRVRSTTAWALCLVLAACGKGDNEPGPGGVTVGEARALDEAAAMLDERRSRTEATPRPAASSPPDSTPSAN